MTLCFGPGWRRWLPPDATDPDFCSPRCWQGFQQLAYGAVLPVIEVDQIPSHGHQPPLFYGDVGAA